MRAALMIRYVLGEMIPTFFIGVLVFVFILLMFQALRLTEFVLIHGVKLTTIAQMMAYLSTSFLPVLFPMSLLFTVLLTYGRLSADSEVVAFRAVGLHITAIIAPALILSVLVAILSLQTSFHIAPWGNRQFETLITVLGSSKPAVTLKEGTFSEGFFDLVVYANKVDSKNGSLQQVFIYDERKPDAPVTVIAREGKLMFEAKDLTRTQNRAALRLEDGDIHSSTKDRHTKVQFSSLDIFLSDPTQEQKLSRSPPSMTMDEINSTIKDPKTLPDKKRELETEIHKRTALGFACILFALIGVGLGTVTNRRNSRGGGTVICLGLIITYYIVYVASEGAARAGHLPPFAAMWLANFLFSIAAIWALRRAWV